MVALGLILIAAGAVAVVAAVGTAQGPVEFLGADLSALAMFFVGLGSGVAILWGFTLGKFGTKRTLRHRRESKRLSELSEKLDKHEAERREEDREQDRSV